MNFLTIWLMLLGAVLAMCVFIYLPNHLADIITDRFGRDAGMIFYTFIMTLCGAGLIYLLI